jgi:hypothetical protein
MMTSFEIEDNVPVPKVHQPGRPSKYPFDTMEIGQSFFARGISCRAVGNAGRHKKPKRFRCRSVIENGIRGTRCWRIA